MCRPESSSRAFTLIELLTVVAIIAVLVALMLPVFGSVRKQGDSTKCLSNLRQIGVGIVSYANDNDGTLPGPLKFGIFPWWDDQAALACRIVNYIEVEHTRFKKKEDVFVCPATFRLTRNTSDAPHFVANALVPMTDSLLLHQPFGYPFEEFRNTIPKIKTTDYEPMPLSRLTDICDENGPGAAARTWAIKDADRLADKVFRGQPYESLLPASKVHGTHRNALFFDFHVGKTDAEP